MKKFCFLVMICCLFGCVVEKEEVASGTIRPFNINEMASFIEMEMIDLESLDSINILVNKSHDLPSDYVPFDLIEPDVRTTKQLYVREVIHNDLVQMFKDAENDGSYLSISSGYRSYEYQSTLFNNYVARDGLDKATRYSARPGQSEHQTGLALDISAKSGVCTLKSCFEDTEEGKWLNEHAWEYGFILRYPKGKEEITGYMFEPWHFRYVGKKEAKKIYDSGLTIEEYYGILD